NAGQILTFTVTDVGAHTQTLSVVVRQGATAPQDIAAQILDAVDAASTAGKLTGVSTALNAQVTGATSLVVLPVPDVSDTPSIALPAGYTLTADGQAVAGDVVSATVSGLGTLTYLAQGGDTNADAIAGLPGAITTPAGSRVTSVEAAVSGGTIASGTRTTVSGSDISLASNVNAVGSTIDVAINGQDISYTVVTGKTSPEDVMAGLVNAIN